MYRPENRMSVRGGGGTGLETQARAHASPCVESPKGVGATAVTARIAQVADAAIAPGSGGWQRDLPLGRPLWS